VKRRRDTLLKEDYALACEVGARLASNEKLRLQLNEAAAIFRAIERGHRSARRDGSYIVFRDPEDADEGEAS
jgi:hypothetical protein